jgi:hypothetical protein
MTLRFDERAIRVPYPEMRLDDRLLRRFAVDMAQHCLWRTGCFRFTHRDISGPMGEAMSRKEVRDERAGGPHRQAKFREPMR